MSHPISPQSERDKLRAGLLGSLQPATDTVELWGSIVEIRQQAIGTIIDRSEQMQKLGVVAMLIQFCYVPGTEIRIFDEADVDVLKQKPYTAELTNFLNKVNKLSGIGNVTAVEEAKNA